MLKRYTDPEALIDAVEVGPEFVTVYINSSHPGKPGSVQSEFVEEFKDILPDPNFHSPSRFHESGDPRGSKWRTWEHKFACHFHFVGDSQEILKQLIDRASLSPLLMEKLNETL